MDAEFPQQVAVANPPGPVRWARVTEDGEYVGVVWVTVHPAARPRAGIWLARGVDPSVAFQRDLGELTLRVRNTDVSATELLAFLAETRTGQGGGLAVGAAAQEGSLADLLARLSSG